MPINRVNVQFAARWLGERHTACIVRLAEDQEFLEGEWMADTKKFHRHIVEEILLQLKQGKRVRLETDLFAEFLLRHYFEVISAAAESAEIEMSVVAPEVKLAARSKFPIPRSLRELRILWDRYRNTGRLPKGFRDRAKEIRDQYLKKTQSVWRNYSQEYREGDEATQQNVLRKVQKAADTVQARAQTIVRTETTNYYNNTRREIYDQADAVWGYLFLAIRDQATTKWCTDKVRKGKRGQHGLVYKKGDPLTDKETPSCHWNCRSEMTPLVIHNPRHRKLIEDERMHRRNHECHPLPEGWR